jgi:hypothetical protein
VHGTAEDEWLSPKGMSPAPSLIPGYLEASASVRCLLGRLCQSSCCFAELPLCCVHEPQPEPSHRVWIIWTGEMPGRWIEQAAWLAASWKVRRLRWARVRVDREGSLYMVKHE